MTAGDEIKFLRSLQRLLDEGDFTATYKFALLQALSDLSVEDQSSGNGPQVLSLERISEKFIEYYWDQALPFRGEAEGDGILRQNNFNQASIVTEVIKARSACDGNLAVARRNAGSWSGLVKRVANTIEKMPLWKLQVIAGKSEDFLYRKSDYVDRKLTLLPGVGANLRAFHGLVTRLVRGRWVERIRTMKANQDLIGKGADLEEFLFGSARRSLDGYGKVLH